MNPDEDYLRVNLCSWDLAILAMMWHDEKFKAYSHSKIRELLMLAQRSDYTERITLCINEYQPPAPRNAGNYKNNNGKDDPIVSRQKEVHRRFGSALITFLNENQNYLGAGMLMKYTLWNVGILEQMFEKAKFFDVAKRISRIENLLKAESIPAPDRILSNLNESVQCRTAPLGTAEKRGENR